MANATLWRDADTHSVQTDSWQAFGTLTSARIALGRCGVSLTTQAALDFGWAHAQARDAIHTPLDVPALAQAISALGLSVRHVHSQAVDRAMYLRRPDLGRQLPPDAVAQCAEDAKITVDDKPRLSVVVADGLSSLAVQKHAVPLLQALLPMIASTWHVLPVTVVAQGRVAVGDPIGAAAQADMAVVLVGERPGLSSPDSMGIYLTWQPQVGCTDAQRNCISNVRPEGLGYAAAAFKLQWLMQQAVRLGTSGVQLKDESDLELHLQGPDGCVLPAS